MGITYFKEKMPAESENISDYNCEICTNHNYSTKSLHQLARILEKFIYENFKVLNGKGQNRINFYQMVGEWMKYTGLYSIEDDDPYKSVFLTCGVYEKLIGQMENELSCLINNLLLQPLQECRIYHNKLIQPLLKRVKSNEITERDHEILHRHISKYQTFSNSIRPKIGAVIEHQLNFSMVTQKYLNTLLQDIRVRKKTKDLFVSLNQLYKKVSCPGTDLRSVVYNRITQKQVEEILLGILIKVDDKSDNSDDKQMQIIERKFTSELAIYQETEVGRQRRNDINEANPEIDEGKGKIIKLDSDENISKKARKKIREDNIKNNIKNTRVASDSDESSDKSEDNEEVSNELISIEEQSEEDSEEENDEDLDDEDEDEEDSEGSNEDDEEENEIVQKKKQNTSKKR